MSKNEIRELAHKIATRHCDKISEQNPQISFEDCFPISLEERIYNSFSSLAEEV